MFNTSYYTSRFFNEVKVVDGLVTKSSTNKDKIKSEFNFYYHLPDNLKRYLIQPFNLINIDDRLSYSMEHIQTPNAAELLLSGYMDKESLTHLLSKVERFRQECPVGDLDETAVRTQSKQLVINKARTRLSNNPEYNLTLDRLEAAYEKYSGDRSIWVSRVSHGDLCLSNILWIESIEMIKLIDPRGALVKDDLYLDEYYDLAKLQHSLVSGYERMLYETGDLPGFSAETFNSYLSSLGISKQFLQVYEASLFLSMIPLHSENLDRSRRFYETASLILDELSV